MRQLHLELRGAKPRLRIRFLDRYEVLLILVVTFVYASVSGFLRWHGLLEGLVRILPLVMFGTGLLMKPRILEWIANRRKTGIQPRAHAEQRGDAASSGGEA